MTYYFMAPRIEGGTFVSLGPGGDVCQQIAKYTIAINYLNQTYITRGNVSQFLGTPQTVKPTFLGKSFCTLVLNPPDISRPFLSQTIKNNGVNKYARCGYTNVTCP